MDGENTLTRLILKYTDDIRYPLIIENPEWEEDITPALSNWVSIFQNKLVDDVSCFKLLRGLIEIIYVMGYRKGRDEKFE